MIRNVRITGLGYLSASHQVLALIIEQQYLIVKQAILFWGFLEAVHPSNLHDMRSFSDL